MAKVTIDVDTQNKTLSVKVGKNSIENVADVYISSEESGGYFMLEVVQREEVDGLRKTTRLTASEKDEEWQEVDAQVATEELSKLLLPGKFNK